MDKALNGIAALNEGFRCIIDEHLCEHQRTQDVEQESRLQQLEDRVLELLRGQLDRKLADVRRELWDHVDERHRVAKALQEESEQGLWHSFQDRAAQLHKQWTLEQESSSTALRRQGEELREELSVHMDQELERLSQRTFKKQRQEIEARLIEDRQQREAQMSQIRAELQEVRLTISVSAASMSAVPVGAAGVPAAAAPAVATSGLGSATGVPPEDETGAASGATESPAAPAMDAASSAPGPSSLCAGETTGVPLVPQTSPGAEAAGSDQGVDMSNKSAETVAIEDGANASSSTVMDQAIMPSNSLSPRQIEVLDNVLLPPPRSQTSLQGPEFADSNAQDRNKQRPPLLGTKGRVIVVLGVIFVLAFLCTFLLMKPFITVYLVAVSLVWIIFLLGEEPMVRMIHSKADKYSSDFCRKKLKMFAACLKRVQNARSSHDKEQQSMVLLYSLSVLGISWNPDATNMIGYLLATFNPALIVPILGLQFLLCCWLARKLVSYLHSPTLRRAIHGTVDRPEISDEATRQLAAIQENLKVTPGSRRHRQAEKNVHVIFQDCEDDMLNELLAEMSHSNSCSLGDVILFFQDQENGNARSEFLKLLCEKRSSDLSVRSKSVVLDALMLMKLSSCEYGESAVGSLLQSACGDELSELKSIQDAGNVHSIHKLVFQDVTREDIRDSIVAHFLQEGIAQVAHRTLMANLHFCKLLDMSKRRSVLPDSLAQEVLNFVESGEPCYRGCDAGHRWLKIFTDIDDTLECSGGRWPAGIDTRYPKHLPYPGATAFYRVLQGGGEVGQLVALSARPHLVGTVMEETVIRKFAHLQEKHGLHCMPALLTGAIDAGTTFLVSGGDDNGMAALGQKKLEKIVEYIHLYPEFRIVFVGDNGQADFAVGQWICEKFPQHVEQVWIHEVQKRENTFSYPDIENKPVAFFEDFVDAASQAATRRNPLIPPEGLLEVVRAAVSDFRKIQNWPSEDGRHSEGKRLTKSIDAARAILLNFGIKTDEVAPLIEEPQTPKTLDKDEKADNSRSWWRPDKKKQQQKEKVQKSLNSPPASTSQKTLDSPPASPSPSPRPRPVSVDHTAIPELPLPATSFTSEGAEEQPEAIGEAAAARGPETAEVDSSGQPSRTSKQALSRLFRRPANNEPSSETEPTGNLETGSQALSTGYKSDAESDSAAEGAQADSDKERNVSYLSRVKKFARSATMSKVNNPSTVPEVDPFGGESSTVREDAVAGVAGAETQLMAEHPFCSVPEGLADLAQEVAQVAEQQEQLISATSFASASSLAGVAVVGGESTSGLSAKAPPGAPADPAGTPATKGTKAFLKDMARRALGKSATSGDVSLKAANSEDAESRKALPSASSTSASAAAEGQDLLEEPKSRPEDAAPSEKLTESPASEPAPSVTPGVSPHMLPASVPVANSLAPPPKENFAALPPSRLDLASAEPLPRTSSEPSTADAPTSPDAGDRDGSALTTPVVPAIEAEVNDTADVQPSSAADPGGASAVSDSTSAKRSIISRIARVLDSSPTTPEQPPATALDAPASGAEEVVDGNSTASAAKASAAEPAPQAPAPATAEAPPSVASVDSPSGTGDSSPRLQQAGNKRSLFSRLRSGTSKQTGKERETSAGALEPLPERSSEEERPAAEDAPASDQSAAPEDEQGEAARGSREAPIRVNPCSSFISLSSLQEGSEEAEELEENQEEDAGSQVVDETEAKPIDDIADQGKGQPGEEGNASSEADAQAATPAASEAEKPQQSES